LAWVAGYVMRQLTCPKAVTHPSTNQARCRATLLIETNALPLHQTANVGVVVTVNIALYAEVSTECLHNTHQEEINTWGTVRALIGKYIGNQLNMPGVCRCGTMSTTERVYVVLRNCANVLNSQPTLQYCTEQEVQ